MSQVLTPEVPSGSGLSVRQMINAVMAALMSNNSGPTEPANPVPFQIWGDTATGDIKIRNTSNTAWILLGDFIGALEYDRAQTLTDAQRAQARNNIRAAVNPDSAQGGTWYRVYAAVSTAMIVPAGGRWACFYIRRNATNGSITAVDAGVHAGGTNLFTTGAADDAHMLVWRVA